MARAGLQAAVTIETLRPVFAPPEFAFANISVSANPAPSPDPLAAPFSNQELRAALGMFATGVTIVTTLDEDGRAVGLTANSFTSVSLDPPLVLWSLSGRSLSMPAFNEATHFAINVLAAEQRQLAERFASKAEDRFDGVAWRTGTGGVPVIEGAAAVFECRTRNRYREGDHVIFLGEVRHCTRHTGIAPLLFWGGRFFTDLPF